MSTVPSPWQPQKIKRIVLPARSTASQVVVVETDQGNGYLKTMGNLAGTHSLEVERLAVSPILLVILWMSLLGGVSWSALASGAAPPLPSALTISEVGTLRGYGGSHEALVFSLDGRTLAVGHGKSAALVLYEVATLQERGRISLPSERDSNFTGASFLNRNRWLATSFRDRVLIWDLAIEKPIFEIPPVKNEELVAISASPAGNLIAVDWGLFVSVWDPVKGKRLGDLRGHSGFIRSVVFSPNGELIATSGTDHTARLWDAGTLRQRAILRGHKGYIDKLIFSPCGRFLVTGGISPADYSVRIWDIEMGKEIGRWGLHRHAINGLAFCSKGRILAAGFDLTVDPLYQKPGQVRFWDMVLRRECGVLEKPSFGLEGIVSTDRTDSSLLAVASSYDDFVRVFRIDEPIRPLPLPARHRAIPAPSERVRGTSWETLASGNAKEAYRAMWAIVGNPVQGVALLRQALRPISPAPRGLVKGLVEGLGSEESKVREHSEAALRNLGELAISELLQAKDNGDLEIRLRALRLLEQSRRPLTMGSRLREVRAVEALELMRTKEARELLEELATGAPEAKLTLEALASLSRLSEKR